MEKTFEESLARLEEIVRSLENGKISLSESLVLFEEGLKLAKSCEDQLKSVQQKATKILENGIEKDFNEE